MLAAGLCLQLASIQQVAAEPGSVSVIVSQRFFDDSKLGKVNGFGEWGAIEINGNVGLYEFPYHIEPYLGVGFIADTAQLYALNDDGSYALDSNGQPQRSEDRLRYQLFNFSLGLRQKFWSPDFFILIPYVQAGGIYRFGRLRKLTAAVDQQKLNLGGDFGAEIGGGFLLSFFYDQETRNDMETTWGLKDFALMTSVRWLPGGWWRHGLGLLDNTGGWDFGLGLFLDW